MSELLKAYALLQSLRQNLPESFEVSREWVDDYHSRLDSLEKLSGQDLKEFRVPDSDLHRQVTGGNYLTGQTTYGNVVVNRSRLLLKVDALLSYFLFQTSEQKKAPIGFRKV